MLERKVRNYFKRISTSGEVGLEIEIEGGPFPISLITRKWLPTIDGSLRGNALEYVLTHPIGRTEVKENLLILIKELVKSGTKINSSDRCGVHVHLNVQENSIKEVINILTLYFILEDLLVAYCGNDREGNSFCLRARDAEEIIDCIRENIINKSFYFDARKFRYAAVNLCALEKFGSIEFRSLRTPVDLMEILTWVEMLLRIKDRALSFEKAEDIVSALSINGAEQFLAQTLGHYAELLQHPNMEVMLMDGVRRAQLIAYAMPMERNDDEES
jgi:hypothetical protein